MSLTQEAAEQNTQKLIESGALTFVEPVKLSPEQEANLQRFFDHMHPTKRKGFVETMKGILKPQS